MPSSQIFTRQRIIFIVIGIMSIGLLLSVGWGDVPPVYEEDPVGFIYIVIEDDDGSVDMFENVSLFSNESLFQVTKRLATEHNLLFAYRDYSGLGQFITRIGEGEATNGQYWQYWVNDVYGQVGAGSYMVRDKDSVVWKLTDEMPQ